MNDEFSRKTSEAPSRAKDSYLRVMRTLDAFLMTRCSATCKKVGRGKQIKEKQKKEKPNNNDPLEMPRRSVEGRRGKKKKKKKRRLRLESESWWRGIQLGRLFHSVPIWRLTEKEKNNRPFASLADAHIFLSNTRRLGGKKNIHLCVCVPVFSGGRVYTYGGTFVTRRGVRERGRVLLVDWLLFVQRTHITQIARSPVFGVRSSWRIIQKIKK